MPLRRGDVRDAVQHLLEKLEQLLHLLPRAGHVLLHCVNVRLDARGHRHVHHAAVSVDGHDPVAVRYLQPVQLHAVCVHHRAHVAGIIRRAVVADLVQGWLYLEAPPAKARRRPAGQVVLFDQQGPFLCQLTLQRRGHSGIAGAHDDYIIFRHDISPFNFIIALLWLCHRC